MTDKQTIQCVKACDHLQRDNIVSKFLSQVSFASATWSRQNDTSMFEQQRDIALNDRLGN